MVQPHIGRANASDPDAQRGDRSRKCHAPWRTGAATADSRNGAAASGDDKRRSAAAIPIQIPIAYGAQFSRNRARHRNATMGGEFCAGDRIAVVIEQIGRKRINATAAHPAPSAALLQLVNEREAAATLQEG